MVRNGRSPSLVACNFSSHDGLQRKNEMLNDFRELLRQNRNYRYMWIGQVVSEIGDHFNNIAVFSLAMEITHSGLVVSGIMLSRAVPTVMMGPLAGVILDR